jgi:hypothetical protein
VPLIHLGPRSGGVLHAWLAPELKEFFLGYKEAYAAVDQLHWKARGLVENDVNVGFLFVLK